MRIKRLTLRNVDELIEFTENNHEVLHQQTYDRLNHFWEKNKKISVVDLFKIKLTHDDELTEVILTVNEDEWETALEIGLVYFEEVEKYEMCSKIKKLLESIN